MTQRRRVARRNPAPSARECAAKAIRFGAGRGPQAAGDTGSDFTELFNVEPFLRNQVTMQQINHLRNRIDSEGLASVCKEIGMCETTLLRVCAGFGHRLERGTAQVLREYFAENKVHA